MIDKDLYYLQIADAVSRKSKCLKKHYGAVIVKNDEILSTGFNGSARKEPHCTTCTKIDLDKDMAEYETCPAIHAEMNAIISAARRDMIGATLYLSGRDACGCTEEIGLPVAAEPCEICLRLIKNAGIDHVVNSNGILYERNDNGILEKVK